MLAPDLKSRRRADKEDSVPCDLPKGRAKMRVGVWVWRNLIFRNKNKFQKRGGGRGDCLAYILDKQTH